MAFKDYDTPEKKKRIIILKRFEIINMIPTKTDNKLYKPKLNNIIKGINKKYP